jgi:hypothetical protein
VLARRHTYCLNLFELANGLENVVRPWITTNPLLLPNS